MNHTTPPPVARGKVFAVAPMMDGSGNPNNTMAYKAS
jgi:hypothetical protein